METLKISIFSLNIKNSVKKRILPFFLLTMAYVRIALRKNLFINYLAEYFLKNHENPKGTIFSFIIFCQKRYFAVSCNSLSVHCCLKESIHGAFYKKS